MSSIVYGVPYLLPPPPPDLWPGVTMKWIGTDGTEWNLHGSRDSGIRMQDGVRGLTVPAGVHTVDEPAGIEGGTWRSYRTSVREVFWPLWVWCDTGSQAWLEYDAAFWDSLDPEGTGLWVVTQPSGVSRSLRCRFVSDGDPSWDLAPGRRGWARYGVTLQAEDPYWLGAPIVEEFHGAEPAPFIGEGGGPPFTVSEASTFTTASIHNPGQVQAWPTWWIIGQDSGQYGAGGKVIDVPFAVEAGRMLVIDTHPAVRTAVEIDTYPAGLTKQAQAAWVDEHLPSGTDRTIELGTTTAFAPVEPRSTTSLTIERDGVGDVQVRLQPRYRRAW